MFNKWLARYVEEQTKMKRFLWLILAIKNELASRAFRALIVNLKINRQKVAAI